MDEIVEVGRRAQRHRGAILHVEGLPPDAMARMKAKLALQRLTLRKAALAWVTGYADSLPIATPASAAPTAALPRDQTVAHQHQGAPSVRSANQQPPVAAPSIPDPD